MKKLSSNRKNQISVAVFLITMLIACAPLISKYCINGHDLEYHLLRIESLKEGIRMGRPFLKVNVLFFGGAGYASSMFYPDFLLYIPAVLRAVGVSINASYHIFAAICIILCYISAYLCIKSMTGSTYAAMTTAVVMSLSQYHLDDIYVRSAVGEYAAFIFVPVVIYAIYNAVYEEMNKPQLFILGYAGVLLCHTSTFAMCTVFGLAAVIAYFKKTILNKKVILRLIGSTAAVLLLTCFYWLPMLEQFLHTIFYVSTPWMQPKDEAVRFVDIFASSFPGLGSICVLLLIPRIFIKKKTGQAPVEETEGEIKETVEKYDKGNMTGYADLLILAGALFTFLTTDLLPWDRIGRYLGFIQFPWRFFIMSSCLFAMAAGLIYGRITGSDDREVKLKIHAGEEEHLSVSAGVILLILVLIINGISAFDSYKLGLQGYYDYSDDYYSYKPYTANVIAGEWLPEAVTDRDSLVYESQVMLTDDGRSVEFSRVKNTIEADIDGNEAYVDVPFIYYLGYEAKLIDGSGRSTALTVTGEGHNGMCRVYTNGNSGRLIVSYGGTVLSHISVLVSAASAVCALIIFVRKRKKTAASGKEGHE